MSDDLVLQVGGQAIGGWKSIQVAAGMERCPNEFNISMTEEPEGSAVHIREGDACRVYLGSDLVVTGYVDRVMPFIDKYSHGVTVVGRGKCQDLIDCAAEWPGGQFSNVTVADIAAGLSLPYGIKVLLMDDPKEIVPQFNLMLGETAFEIIERVCRFQALLAYESPKGELVLSRVGSKAHASGLKEGVNVVNAHGMRSVDQQYSEYHAYMMGFNIFKELGDQGNLIQIIQNPTIKRNRKRFILMENGDAGEKVTRARLQWEANRRLGRSQCVRVTTDSWRDASGALYTPNKLIDVDIPSIGFKGWTGTVSDVVYRRDSGGTSCDMLIMPPAAFQPQPILLNPTLAELREPR